MLPTAGLLLSPVVWLTTAQAATPLTFVYTDPTGQEATLELTTPFEHTLEANLGKEVHRLVLSAPEDGDLTANLVTIRKGKENAARSIEKGLPSTGNSMSFIVTYPSHKSSTLAGAAAKWNFRVTATEVNVAGKSGKIRRDWKPTAHATHTLPHVRVKSGGRLFAEVGDTEPIAVWPADTWDMGAEVVDQQGGRLKLRRVTQRDLCDWPARVPHVQLEGWVELADLNRVLVNDEIQVHSDGTALWLYAGAPLERVSSDHLIPGYGLVIPSTSVVSDRFTPTAHPAVGEIDKRADSTTVKVDGATILTARSMLPIVDRSPDGSLAEVVLPAKCGRAVVVPAEANPAGGGVEGGTVSGTVGAGNSKAVPATTAAELTWPDGRPAGQMVPLAEGKGDAAVFYKVKGTKNGRTCATWSPTGTPPAENPGIELCWKEVTAPAPEPAPAE